MSEIADELSNLSSRDASSSSQNNDSSLGPPLEFEVFELRDTINIVAYFSMSAGKHIWKLNRYNRPVPLQKSPIW